MSELERKTKAELIKLLEDPKKAPGEKIDMSEFEDGRPFPFLRSRKKFSDMTQAEYLQYQKENAEYNERKWQNIEEQKKAQREKDRILRMTHGRYASLESIPQEEKGDYIAK